VLVMMRALMIALLLGAVVPARAELDLDSWSQLLGMAVTDGAVDYRLWRDNRQFDALVEQVGSTRVDNLDREQALVFYINAYNILAARGILDGSSPASFFARQSYFKRDKYTVAGKRMTLHELEHGLIRPLGEARIHFAIVCASQSCPVLRAEAYVLARLEQQLDDATRSFINDSRRNRFDPGSKRAEVSRLFDWFEEDFQAAAGSVQQFLARYVEDPAAAAQLQQQGFRLGFMDYDWSLNGIK
jgi:hypothetical protein